MGRQEGRLVVSVADEASWKLVTGRLDWEMTRQAGRPAQGGKVKGEPEIHTRDIT